MKTIAIVTPKIDTFSNPTLILLFEKLIEQNYKILFFGFEQIFIPKKIREKLIFCEFPFNFYKSSKTASNIAKILKQYFQVFKILKIDNKVKTIICVDPMGLVIAGRIKRLVNVKIIYASFEIFFEEEFHIIRKKILKKLERKYSKNVSLVIIQDDRREKLLREVNDFSEGTKFMHIPVSPKQMDVLNTGYDIYGDLNIPKDKTIAVYSGTLQGWSGVNELTDLFESKWNDDMWLVLHSHHILEDKDELRIKIQQLEKLNCNITFHNKPFYDYNKYIEFLSKCHIGIATYFPNTVDVFAGKNIEEIGLSSGKFSTYMMLGIPTVTTSNYIYKELNNKYQFGETINTMDELPAALININKNYHEKVNACKALFKNQLEPESRIGNLINYIDKSNDI
ncbi:MAG: hypothetical protein ABIY50_02260 [Ignavibacteria bacterium]